MPPANLPEALERAAASRQTARWAQVARALDQVGRAARDLPDTDPGRIRWTAATAEAAWILGDTERARVMAGDALRAAEAGGTAEVVPLALRVLGTVTWRTGDLRGGAALLDRALQRSAALGDQASVVACRLELSLVALDQGLLDRAQVHLEQAFAAAGTDPVLRLLPQAAWANLYQRRADRDGAEALYEGALDEARTLDHPLCEGAAQQGLANLALERSDPKLAIARLREAHKAYAIAGYKHGECQCYNALGEAQRQAGDRAQAVRAYERAVEAGDAMGSPGLLPRANLAVLRLEDGRVDDARVLVEAVLANAEARGIRPMVASMHVLMLPCVVEDEAALAYHLQRAADGVVETGIYDRDLAWAAQQAADVAPFPALRVRCRALALHQFERLGDPAAVRVERSMLAELARKGAPIPAGPFDLVAPLGEGSMGEVWTAKHRLGFDAAVKVVAAAPQRERLLALLEGEARAVAGLDHPNIIRMIDFGTLGPEAAAMRPQLHAGAPWFAMELVRGGSLEDQCGKLSWERCRHLLAELLAALAHAHARGVLHLDVKPANVLLSNDPTPVTKLVDFGLAAVLSSAGGRVRVAGTPLYMAPEQFLGDSRDWGPWTDLYALGCMAVHLVTGQPAHHGADLRAIREAHLRGAPRIDLPDGVPGAFKTWVEALIARDPADRFRFAADAAEALNWSEEGGETQPMPVLPAQAAPAPDRARSGLALFELRRPPLVGRQAERSAMWKVLRRVLVHQLPAVLVLSGGTGVGKTALARWLAERVHAEGRASTWWARADADDPIGALVAGRTRVDGLSREAAERRIAQREPGLSEAEVLALAAIGTGDRPDGFRIDAALDALVHLIELDCEDRPLVIHVEGSAAKYPAVGRLAERLAASGLPVLLLLERRPEDPRAARGGEPEHVELVEVEPLPDQSIRELLDAMLPLSAELGAALVDRSVGNPRLALHLMGSLIRRDAVASGSRGVVLRAGVSLDLPEDLIAVWRERLDEVLQGLGDEVWTALTVAALLGSKVAHEDWRAACETEGIRDLSGALRRLRQARLAVPTEDRGFAFVHPVLREVIFEVARERGLAEMACRAAAAAPGLAGDPARRGVLLADAGELAAAAPVLLDGAIAAVRDGDVLSGRALVRRLGDTLRALGVPADDERWARLYLVQCHLAVEHGDPVEGEEHAEALLTVARRIGHRELQAEALRWMATIDWIGRRPELAIEGFEEAREMYEAADAPLGQAQCEHGIAIVERARARYDVAIAHLSRAAELLELEPDPPLLAGVHCSLGDVYRRQGELTRSEQAFRVGLKLAQASGDRSLESTALLGLGELARKRGDLDGAEAHYTEALRMRTAGQRLKASSAQLNLALVAMARGRFESAEQMLLEVIERLDANEASAVVQWARIALLPVVAARAEAEWSVARATVDDLLASPMLRDPDVAWCLQLAGDRAAEAGFAERARACRKLAAEHWRSVGQPDRAEAVERSG